jgi:FdhD protein
MQPFQAAEVVRVRGAERERARDVVAAEEPMELRLGGVPFSVIMRTPGADVDLAAGFLLAEGVITSADELGVIEHCRDPEVTDEDSRENIVNVTLAGAALERMPARIAGRRQVTMTSACGLCGRREIAELRATAPAITSREAIRRHVVAFLPERLRARQAAFDETGGLHAAALFTAEGDLQLLAEDVGRHNAVDKVIGRMLLLDRLPLAESALFVSGRTSYEIVQKAFLAGVPIVASVSAPSSLAIDLAREAGITLLGFVRGDRFNIYTHEDRIEK